MNRQCGKLHRPDPTRCQWSCLGHLKHAMMCGLQTLVLMKRVGQTMVTKRRVDTRVAKKRVGTKVAKKRVDTRVPKKRVGTRVPKKRVGTKAPKKHVGTRVGRITAVAYRGLAG